MSQWSLRERLPPICTSLSKLRSSESFRMLERVGKRQKANAEELQKLLKLLKKHIFTFEQSYQRLSVSLSQSDDRLLHFAAM